MKHARRIAAAWLILGSTGAAAQQPGSLLELGLQDLLEMEVTSASRKEQQVARTAAAVYVLTQEDIRRSGATTLPEAFRMVPGLSVGQLDAGSWSVASRGFSGLFANKLLVLVDGRSIYTPTYGGVHWEMQTIPLETIEQIEIIRGPGGSLWGANAINGVINIITRPADELQGARLIARAGTHDRSTVEVGYGGRVGQRVYHTTRVRYLQRRSPEAAGGVENGDGFETAAIQTRWDWTADPGDRFSVRADVQDGLLAQTYIIGADQGRGAEAASRSTTPFTAGNVAFAWDRTSSRVDTDVQAYYSGFTRDTVWDERWHILDVDLHQRRAIGMRQDVVYGLEYRFSATATEPSPSTAPVRFRIIPDDARRHLVTGFVQDEIALSPALSLTPGVKFERNGDTGLEWQPSIRTLWAVTPVHTVWGAASRAVRTPNRLDRGLQIDIDAGVGPGGLPLQITSLGNPDFKTESLWSAEAGYRARLDTVSVDVAAFAADYDRLISTVPLTPGVVIRPDGSPAFRVATRYGNGGTAQTAGGEVAVAWRPLDWWSVSGSYSLLSATTDGTLTVAAGSPVPRHQWHARTYLTLLRQVELSAMWYRASDIPALEIASHNRLDLHTAWMPVARLELSGGVRNLLRDEDEPEFRDTVSGLFPSPAKPEAYLQASWRFR